MKNFFIITVVILTLLFIGCQESSITDPIQPLDNEFLKDNNDNQSNIIRLNRLLIDPYPIVNSYYVINGQVEYQLTIVPYSTNLKDPDYIVYVNLSLDASFTNFCTVCEPPLNDPLGGTISIETGETIYLSEKGKYLLEKSFLIEGREDQMYLVCRFAVTTNGIELDRMVLHLEQDDTDISQIDL